MNANKVVIAVVLIALGFPLLVLMFVYVPGIFPVLLAVGIGLLFRKRSDGRYALLEWFAQMGETKNRNTADFSAVKRPERDPHADFHARREPPRPRRTSSPDRVSAQVDAHSYSYENTDQYCGSTGKDPWELRAEKSPWEQPPERNPWER